MSELSRPEIENDELPEPSAELVLWRVHVEAMLAVLSRKKGERYLTYMTERLAWEDNLSAVFNIRPQAQHAQVRRARRQAARIYERYLPVFHARLPRK